MVSSNSNIVIVRQPYYAEAFSQTNIPWSSATSSCFMSDGIDPTKINTLNVERLKANHYIDNLPIIFVTMYTH